jgi:flagellar basal-body rod protein FlgC
MDLFRALDVSASGLTAQRSRMEVIAENLANSETTVSANGGPYRRRAVVLEAADGRTFPSMLRRDGLPDGGVQAARTVELTDPPRKIFLPGHPQAGTDGYVSFPNVNPLTEMVDMLATTRAYEANATAFQATKQMGSKLLEILR